ncbi:hypothetical protein JCM33374_g5130 [Metschnikowia sp. JCM 33374]|nr:hypothetical protein JCM33374_g5130 [Metschnikowia sp. JCM 33374]
MWIKAGPARGKTPPNCLVKQTPPLPKFSHGPTRPAYFHQANDSQIKIGVLLQFASTSKKEACTFTPLRQFRWSRKVHQLHEKHGEVVILSPDAVSCNGDPKYVHDIYVKNMPKSKYYENFRFHGEVNMFAELDNAQHLRYKKMIQGLYSKTAVFNPKNTTRNNIVENVRELVNQVYLTSVSGEKPDLLNAESKLNPHGKGHQVGSGSWFHPSQKKTGLGIDVHSLFASLAMDVVSAFELGPHNGTRLLQNPHHRSILVPHRMVSAMVAWTTQMPRFWSWAAGPAVRSSHRRWSAGSWVSMSDNLIAGHDTTSIQLTYLCYELSRPVHHDIQQRLRTEIRAEFGNPRSLAECIDDFERVDKLPYLEALFQENLRVHASTPGAEPRVTSAAYDVVINGKTVTLPPGTGISCQPYSMHRDEKVFAQPETWDPERWLQNKEESLDEYNRRIKEMQHYMMPFGKGIRMCIGLNIAVIEIKLAMVNLYWRYQSELCSDWCDITPAEKSGVIHTGTEFARGSSDESMMSKVDSYIMRPYHDECWLEWSEV